jgi:hypothetical protein
MKWNIMVLVISYVLLILNLLCGLSMPLISAEGIAVTLSKKIGVEKEVIWTPIEDSLREDSLIRTFLSSTSLIIMSGVLTVRLFFDYRATINKGNQTQYRAIKHE